MANIYDNGDVVRTTVRFTDSSSTLVDPTALSMQYKDPAGNVVTYIYGTDVELVKSSTGIYYADISIDEIGIWYYRFTATGTNASAVEGSFTVRESEFD